jgi:hypothetical protein
MAETDRAERPDSGALQRWYAQEAADMPDRLVLPPDEDAEDSGIEAATAAQAWPSGWWILPVVAVSALLWVGLIASAFG